MLGHNNTDSAIEKGGGFDLSHDISGILESFSLKKSTAAPRQPRQNPGSADLGRRAHFRHPVRWRVAIVNNSGGTHQIYHGRTYDMSMSGISILLEHNVIFTSKVVVLVAIPPMHPGQKEIIVEVQSSLMHTVLDPVHNQFRLGMRFINFKGDGQKILSDILSKRYIPEQASNHTYF